MPSEEVLERLEELQCTEPEEILRELARQVSDFDETKTPQDVDLTLSQIKRLPEFAGLDQLLKDTVANNAKCANS